MELRDALSQIAEIRTQIARTQVFRGYRSATTAISGGIALLAAALQPVIIADPAQRPGRYVAHWAGAAGLSMLIVGIEMVVRARRSPSRMQAQLTMLAVEQFLPSVVAGALLTYVIVAFSAASAWLLPGLWMIIYSLGMFASWRVLPKPTFAVAGFFLLAGLATIVLSARGHAFSPWLMGGVFGLGQALMAAVLYLSLERSKEAQRD